VGEVHHEEELAVGEYLLVVDREFLVGVQQH
jgi:hypothetical protein